jgi:hypothetical protein
MKKVWIEILNEIISAKDNVALTLKLSRHNIIVTVGDYKKIIRRFPHLKTIEKLIDRLKEAGCIVDQIQEMLDSTTLTEQWTYIIKKPETLNAATQSTFLYALNDIEAECIDYTYTGNLIPKETGGIVQRLVINTDNNTFKIDINSIGGQPAGLISVYKAPNDPFSRTEYVTTAYERFAINMQDIEYALAKESNFSTNEISTILALIDLYTKYL